MLTPSPFRRGDALAYKAREIFDDGSEMEVVLKHFKDEMLEEEDDEAELIKAESTKWSPKTTRSSSTSSRPPEVCHIGWHSFQSCGEGDGSGRDGSRDVLDRAVPSWRLRQQAITMGMWPPKMRSPPHLASSHHHTGGALVVTDLQGVGSLHGSSDTHTRRARFGAGNLGERGIQRFLQSHRHTLLCERLGLPSPDAGLTDEELARKLQEDEARRCRRSMKRAKAMERMHYDRSYGGSVDELSRMLGGRPTTTRCWPRGRQDGGRTR